MSFQQPIYNPNGNFKRNQTAPVLGTSSDMCIFNMPYFSMSGASKINCKEVSCSISGISYNNILTATTECFTTNLLSGACFNDVSWQTRVYEDNSLVYSGTFYTSTSITGETPSISEFSGSVVTAFNTLDYDYSFSGSNYTIGQITNVKNLKLEIKTDINYDDNCPLTGASSGSTFSGVCSGYSETICDLDFSGLTVSDSNVYSLTRGDGIDVEFNFTANTTTFDEINTQFRFEVYKFNKDRNWFDKPAVYESEVYEWSGFSATSAVTVTIPSDEISLDGDYLIKGYYVYDACTEFANLLGDKYSTFSNIGGDEYRLYRGNRDFYFVAFTEVDKPNIQQGANDIVREIGSLTVESRELNGTEESITLPKYSGDILIALNGLTLSKDLDYTISSTTVSITASTNFSDVKILSFLGPIVSGDILTMVYTNSEVKNNLYTDVIDIDSTIVSGSTNGQGSNKIYYNTDTNKYEAFIDLTPINGNNIGVTLNGITLANNVDYYQSITNPKRIIFEGEIVVGDILNIYYNTDLTVQGDIYTTQVSVGWNIATPPQNEYGVFTVEVASDTSFTNIVSSAQTNYIVNIQGYSTPITLIGNIGDKLYYRVKNEKRYIDLCGNPIITTEYSDYVPITLQTNAFNSY
jgi:hypothetical protein